MRLQRAKRARRAKPATAPTDEASALPSGPHKEDDDAKAGSDSDHDMAADSSGAEGDDDYGVAGASSSEDEAEAGQQGGLGSDDEEEEDEDVKEAREAHAFQRKLNKAATMELLDDAKRDKPAAMDSDGEEEGEESEDEIRDLQRPLPVPKRRQRIAYIQQVLANFKELGKGYSRSEYMQVLLQDLQSVYDYSEWLLECFARLFPPAELLQFLDANDTARPETIRANTLKVKRRDLAQALIKRGINVDPLEKWSKEGLVVYEASVALGGTPEYLAGHYMLQAAASLLPVIALQPQEGERVLDMAAAPGGKTTHVCQLLKNSGLVVANDVSKDRLRALSANVHRLGCSNVLMVNYDGRDLPRLCKGLDRVLLDAPCTGTGIISKDPKVKMTKTLEDLRQCTRTQKQLLLAAIDCCGCKGPNNVIVYSTCSVLCEENEQVIEYALQRRNVRLVDTGLPFGRPGLLRYGPTRLHPTMELCRRFYPHIHNLDGFFVAKLQKYADGAKPGKYPVLKQPPKRLPKRVKRLRRKEAELEKKERKQKPAEYRPPPENKRLTREERDLLLAAKRKAKEAARKAPPRKKGQRLGQGKGVRRPSPKGGAAHGAGPAGPKGNRPKKGRPATPAGAGPSAPAVGLDTGLGAFQATLLALDQQAGSRPRTKKGPRGPGPNPKRQAR